MASDFEKSVKGGTKVKLAPPKSKYVEHILLATQSGEAGVAEVFRTLTHRLRDSTWTVTFKSLIIVHLMIKEGALGATLGYLAGAPRHRLAISAFTDVQTQGQNIRRYSEYLIARAHAYAVTHCDYVREGDGRMGRLTVDKGLLRETEVVQDQIRALVKCDFFSTDVDNEITLTAFRLLTLDLLALYNVENEAVMNVLGHYFEMSRPDVERAIKIYKAFCKQTEQVVQYLSVARQYSYATRLEIPKIKHAPTGLVNSLQEYHDDKDFEINRRQYLAEQEAKSLGKPKPKLVAQAKPSPSPGPSAVSTQPATSSSTAATQPAAKGPAPDLIDFFESIEQNQQPMVQNVPPQYQQQPTGFQPPQNTGFVPQQQPPQAFGLPQQTGVNGFATNGVSTNPFAPSQPQPQPQQQQPPPQLQTQFTGAGFGGYVPQSPQQQPFPAGNAFAQHQQQQQQQFASPVQTQSPAQIQSPQGLQPQPTGSTNPFRQSVMATGGAGFGGSSFGQPDLRRQSTNPFARGNTLPPVAENGFAQQPQRPPQQTSPFAPQQPTSPFSPQQQQPLQAQPTGTNPFARNTTPTQQPNPPPNALQVQPTGSTNPFRQSMFVNQQTGQGWQNAPQATMGGLENLNTIPIFPRPGQAQPQQSPWG